MHNAEFLSTMWQGAIPGLRAAHETARAHHFARRRGGLAAYGTRTAAGDADDRLSARGIARGHHTPHGCLSRGPEGRRVRGRADGALDRMPAMMADLVRLQP